MKKSLVLLKLLLLCASSGFAESYKLQALTVSADQNTWERVPHPVFPDTYAIKLATRDRSKVAIFIYLELADIAKTEADEAGFLSGVKRSIAKDKSLNLLSEREITVDGIPACLYHHTPLKNSKRDTITVIFLHQRMLYYTVLQSQKGKTIEDEEIKTLFGAIRLEKASAG